MELIRQTTVNERVKSDSEGLKENTGAKEKGGKKKKTKESREQRNVVTTTANEPPQQQSLNTSQSNSAINLQLVIRRTRRP